MDQASLNLVSFVLGGTGLFVVLTRFSVPELNVAFLGINPYAIKRDIIESVMTWVFTLLALSGLLVQVVVVVAGPHIQDRAHSTWYYLGLSILAVIVASALVPLLMAVGNRIARRSWIPKIVESHKDVYETARFILKHEGWREDQLAVRATLPDPETYRLANLNTARSHIEQLERLFEVIPVSTDLEARLTRLSVFFEGAHR